MSSLILGLLMMDSLYDVVCAESPDNTKNHALRTPGMASAVEPGATKSPQVGNSTFLIPQANKYVTTGSDRGVHDSATE